MPGRQRPPFAAVYVLRNLIRVDAVGEPQNSLEMRTASRQGQRRTGSLIPVLGTISIAPPGDRGDLLFDISLELG